MRVGELPTPVECEVRAERRRATDTSRVALERLHPETWSDRFFTQHVTTIVMDALVLCSWRW